MRDVPPIVTALRGEWFRLSRRTGVWVIIGLATALVAGVLGVTWALIHLTPLELAVPPRGFPHLASASLSLLAPFLGIILAAMIFGGDYGWGTLRPLLARGQPRWQVVLTKLLLTAVILAAFWVAAWVLSTPVGLVAGDPAAGAEGSFLDVPDGWWPILGSSAGAWLVALAYAGLTALLCTIGRSTAFGLGVAVAILIFEFTVYPVAGLVADLVTDFPLGEYTRWTLHGTSGGVTGGDELSAWVFLPATLAYIAAFCALTLLVTQRRDVASGNG